MNRDAATLRPGQADADNDSVQCQICALSVPNVPYHGPIDPHEIAGDLDELNPDARVPWPKAKRRMLHRGRVPQHRVRHDKSRAEQFR